MMRCNYTWVPLRVSSAYIDYAASGIEPGTVWLQLLSSPGSTEVSLLKSVKHLRHCWPPALPTMTETFYIRLSSREVATHTEFLST